jgi:glycosyltransferase involved in cell wall biosynthesis
MDFTIITPSYNYGRFIGECLQSVADQSGVTFEHLVMDACSTDNTAEVIEMFPHATLHREPDKGMSDGINKGFEIARGDWVMWLNADDLLKPDALKSVLAFADSVPIADVIFGCWDFMDEDGNFLRRMTVFPYHRSMMANHGCYIASTSTFFRRKTTIDQGYFLNVRFRAVMDREYFCRLAAAGKRFVYFPKALADFRLHGSSISQKHIGSTDIDGVLSFQLNEAESRAIRRVYGLCLFRDELLNGIVEGVVSHCFRFLKFFLRAVYRSRTLD